MTGARPQTTQAPADALRFSTSRIPAVNVACVPQRSPLRYPGGKTWLIPHIREWLARSKPSILFEPFAGGGIVSLTAVMEGFVDLAVMIELDHDVAAFWHSALRDSRGLASAIKEFKPTRDVLCSWDADEPRSVREHGFRTLVLNRTRRAGILAQGASFMRVGENGKGLLSRWYPETLATRLSDIADHADKIVFCEGDGMRLLPPLLHGWGKRAAVFLDPPYTAGGKKAGARLYANSTIDHEGLFRLLAKRKSSFLMTYDEAPEIVKLVHKHRFHAVRVEMRNAHNTCMRELVITRDSLFG